MKNLEIRPSTAELLRRFYGSVPKTQRSFCVMDGERVVAVAGVHLDHGRLILFSDTSADQNKQAHKFLIVRLAKRVLGLANGLPVHAYAENDCSARFLEYLGFENNGGVYVWQH